MASALKKLNCMFCGELIENLEHIQIDEDGEVVAACNDCYQKAELIVKGRKENGRSTEICSQKIK